MGSDGTALGDSLFDISGSGGAAFATGSGLDISTFGAAGSGVTSFTSSGSGGASTAVVAAITATGSAFATGAGLALVAGLATGFADFAAAGFFATGFDGAFIAASAAFSASLADKVDEAFFATGFFRTGFGVTATDQPPFVAAHNNAFAALPQVLLCAATKMPYSDCRPSKADRRKSLRNAGFIASSHNGPAHPQSS